MSGCGNTDPCAPVNPCDCAETADIREQGPPGARGLPGGIPVFQVGTVSSGGVPSVTIVQVNPLLYTINFVFQSVSTSTANIWSAIQTFEQQAIFQGGIAASGSSTIETLTVTGDGTFQGTALFVGDAVFNSVATFNGGIVVTNGATVDNETITGTLTLSGIQALAANVCYKGYVVVDSCGRLRFVNGFSPNSVAGSNSLSQTVTFNQAETAISFNLPFTVPSVPDCGTAMSVNATIFGRVVTGTSGSLPADISRFLILVRLDNSVTGTILASGQITNLEAASEWNVNAQIQPGPHTLYFTVQGQGFGSSSITLIEIDCSVNF